MWQNGHSHTAIIMMIPEKTDNPSHLHDHNDAIWHERQAITLSRSYLTIQTGLHIIILSWCFLTSYHIHSLSWSHLTIQTGLHMTVITMMLSDKPSHCHDHIWQYKHAFTLSYYHDASWQAITLSWSYLTIQTGRHITMITTLLPDKPSHCHNLTRETGIYISMIIMMLPDKPSRCHVHIWQERQAFTRPWLLWCFLTSHHTAMIISDKRGRHLHLHDYHASWQERQAVTLPWP